MGGINNALVTGAGSLWYNSGVLEVGPGLIGLNSLTIADGATVIATDVGIGSITAGGNTITVDGGYLYATNATGTGVLRVQKGALSLTNDAVVVADVFYANNGASSVVNLNGGTLSVGSATVSNGASFFIGNGVSEAALLLRSGVSSFANDLVIRNNASLTIYNTVNIAGNFTPNIGSALVVEFGGTTAGQYGYLNIAGTASLTGLVEAVAFNGFTPTNGMQITFLHASGGWTNGFSSFTNLTTLPSQTALAAFLIYPDANDVAVKWNYYFTPYAQTPNQLAVANALNAEVNTPGLTPLMNYLGGLPVGQLSAAFDSLSPQGLTAMPQVGTSLANTQLGNLQSRFGALRNGVGGGFNGGFSLFDPSGVMDWIDRQPRFASMLSTEQELAMTRDNAHLRRHATVLGQSLGRVCARRWTVRGRGRHSERQRLPCDIGRLDRRHRPPGARCRHLSARPDRGRRRAGLCQQQHLSGQQRPRGHQRRPRHRVRHMVQGRLACGSGRRWWRQHLRHQTAGAGDRTPPATFKAGTFRAC